MKQRVLSLITGAVIATSVTSANMSAIAASTLTAQDDFSSYGLGCTGYGFAVEAYAQNPVANATAIASTLPTAVDLSIDSAFPPIGNQESINSCVGWATTYYAFTYMAHKLNGITSTASNAYSPKWTYNLTNGGVDCGSDINNALLILKHRGALTVEKCPYYTNNVFTPDWSNDVQAMIDALSVRISNSTTITMNAHSTSDFTSKLTAVKQGINNGKVYIVNMTATSGLSASSKRKCTDSNHLDEDIYIRNAGTNANGMKIGEGHALTVVGYDDSVWCDVNNNGVVDTGETGALKVANSWGTDFGNNGYMWVLYDALLANSQIKTASDSNIPWDQSLATGRKPFFSGDGYYNAFTTFDVANYRVGFVSEITITTSDINQVHMYSLKSNSSGATTDGSADRFFFSTTSTKIPFSGTIVLNNADSANLDAYLSGYSWGGKVSDTNNDAYPVTNMSCKIVDNRRNLIATCTGPTTVNGTAVSLLSPINLVRGDTDYDGQLTLTDADFILNYLAGLVSISTVQSELADYNNDGRVAVADVIALKQYLSEQGIDVSSIDVGIQNYLHNRDTIMEVE